MQVWVYTAFPLSPGVTTVLVLAPWAAQVLALAHARVPQDQVWACRGETGEGGHPGEATLVYPNIYNTRSPTLSQSVSVVPCMYSIAWWPGIWHLRCRVPPSTPGTITRVRLSLPAITWVTTLPPHSFLLV